MPLPLLKKFINNEKRKVFIIAAYNYKKKVYIPHRQIWLTEYFQTCFDSGAWAPLPWLKMYGLILQNMAEFIRNKEWTGYKALKSKWMLFIWYIVWSEN